MAEVTITKQNFEAEVLNAKELVVVDFWAVWCGPCQMLAPVLKETAEEYAGRIKVGKVNVDEEMELAMQYGIASIPTLLFFKGGQLIATEIGYRDKAQLQAMIDRYLG